MMKIGMFSAINWCMTPQHHGQCDNTLSPLTERLVKKNVGMMLLTAADLRKKCRLAGICSRVYEDDPSIFWRAADLVVYDGTAGIDNISKYLYCYSGPAVGGEGR